MTVKMVLEATCGSENSSESCKPARIFPTYGFKKNIEKGDF
jgi:hypothetical protein